MQTVSVYFVDDYIKRLETQNNSKNSRVLEMIIETAFDERQNNSIRVLVTQTDSKLD